MTQVLIVEDDELNRKLIGAIVGDMDGFTMIADLCPTFSDVQTIASNPRVFIDIAIVDGQFPLQKGGAIKNDAGRTTAEYLRRVRPGIKILACSGNEEDSLDWADAFLRKPFNIAVLEATLIELASSIQPEPS